MKISERTILLLKSFALIKPSITLEQGNEISTISALKTILAKATVEEDFPVKCSIYDLNGFLSAISLIEDPEFDFDSETCCVIHNDSNQLRYYFANQFLDIDKVPVKSLTLKNVTCEEGKLKQSQIKQLKQATAVLRVDRWSVVGKDGELSFVVNDSKNTTSNTFKVIIGETEGQFKFDFKAENMLMIPADYTFNISQDGISHFWTSDNNLEYYITTENR